MRNNAKIEYPYNIDDVCPITLTPIRDIKNPALWKNKIYDFNAIYEWVKKNPVNPNDNKPIEIPISIYVIDHSRAKNFIFEASLILMLASLPQMAASIVNEQGRQDAIKELKFLITIGIPSMLIYTAALYYRHPSSTKKVDENKLKKYIEDILTKKVSSSDINNWLKIKEQNDTSKLNTRGIFARSRKPAPEITDDEMLNSSFGRGSNTAKK